MKKIPYYLLLIALASCSNLNSDKVKDGEETIDSGTDGKLSTELPSCVTTDALEKAKKDGETVFLIITGRGTTGVEQAIANVKDANTKFKNSNIYTLDRDNSANSELVAKFGISTVPLPFILVISRKGMAVAGGQPEQMTAEQIIKSVPTPKQDEVYSALDEKKPVFIVVSKKDYSDKEEALANCKKASDRNNLKPVIVEIDFDDPAETIFLRQLGITSINGSTLIAVANASGQITELFHTKPTSNQLNSAANKVIQKSGGCCPGGSGKGCG